MRRIILSIALLLGCLPAHAATITIASDQPTYEVGDTITLTVTGDPEGATGWGAYGALVWDPALADTLSVTQQPLGDQWLLGGGTALPATDGHGVVWNQIHEQAFVLSEEAVGGTGVPITSIIVLRATSPGTLTFAWEEETTYRAPTLDFFGATATPYSVQINGLANTLPSVPEPSAALVFAASLVVCAVATRRRSA